MGQASILVQPFGPNLIIPLSSWGLQQKNHLLDACKTGIHRQFDSNLDFTPRLSAIGQLLPYHYLIGWQKEMPTSRFAPFGAMVPQKQ